MPLPSDYAERVYAGVLGKTIGVYLGRPFEGWSYQRIQERLGDIEYYVHDKLNVPLIVTDDDISGTFTFIRALADNGYRADLSAREIGNAWLNYLVEERTILWWGGLGNSTEHTAYLRLKQGIPAPDSGSMRLNGQVVSEQIGAQIFIDGWAMVSPGDPAQAARLAGEAARVSHDGAAVDGAIVLAVMEALAFVEQDTNRLLDAALGYIPADSIIRTLIDDIRTWHARENDWRATREQIEATYGYDKYGGNCHMVPNHGLIIHALLHGNDDFSETMKIINTCGWDTDCNSGNIGCLMGIKLGLPGIDAGLQAGSDWRGPVADRIYIPTADPTWGISDCAAEAVSISNAGRRLAGEDDWRPKDGAQFHFALPGSTQGFMVTEGDGELANDSGQLRLTASGAARFGSPVFAPSKAVAKTFEGVGYALMASPRIYPGQVVTANIAAQDTACTLYVAWYGAGDEPTFAYSAKSTPGAASRLTLTVPPEAHPLFEVGIEMEDAGTVVLDSVSWAGVPAVTFARPDAGGTMWRRAWINGVDQFTSRGEPYRLIQNTGRGLLIQGSREWRNYAASADVTPHLASAAGIAARVQGMRRYYALLLHAPGELRLVRMLDSETVLASCAFDWSLGETRQLSITVDGSRIRGAVDGIELLVAEDDSLDCGSTALVIEEGRTATRAVSVAPVS